MVVLEIAVLLIAVAFTVLVGYLVLTLIQLKRTMADSEQLIDTINAELPLLLKEMREMTANLNALAEQTRDGVEHAAVFLHAMGSVGDTVQQVHRAVQGTSGNLLTNLASMVAGFRAATAVVKDRFKEGEDSNGG